jgi:hypothetical protein
MKQLPAALLRILPAISAAGLIAVAPNTIADTPRAAGKEPPAVQDSAPARPTACGPSSRPGKAPAVIFPPDDRLRVPLRSTTPIAQRFHDVIALGEQWDPRRDDMLAETLAFLAERRLTQLSTAILGDDQRAAGALLVDDATATGPLRPASLRLVYAHGMLRVSWPHADTRRLVSRSATGNPQDGAPDKLAGAGGPLPLTDALRAFVEPLPREVERGLELSITRIVDAAPEAFDSVALVTAWGLGEPRVRQQNATWRIRWTLEAGLQPPPGNRDVSAWDALERSLRIVRVEPLDYEEIEDSGGPRFVDCTDAVLARVPQLRQIIALDTGHWSRNLDRLAGADLLGHTGLCVGDVNGDGLDDLYLTQPGGLPNALLVQQPDGSVLDAAAKAGVDFLDSTRAGLLIDADNDGDRDLVLSILNATVVMENRGDGTFVPNPVLNARTINSPAQFFSIAAADYDRDRFLDLYSVRYVRTGYGVDIPMPLYDARSGPQNHLICIRPKDASGRWNFEERTLASGLEMNNRQFSLAAAWEDFDDDGDPDLYVANDFGRANLYVQEDGRFRDEAAERGAENQAAGMGVTWGDFDRDGLIDLYVSNMFSPAGVRIMSRPEFRAHDPPEVRQALLRQVTGNALFRGRPGGRFEVCGAGPTEDLVERGGDRPLRLGIEGWSWGARFVDINNDGYLDLLVPNGNFTNRRAEDLDSLFWRHVAAASPTWAERAPQYSDAWAAVSLMMLREFSWAGRQRHATYLNLRDGSFADVSCISGFGFKDDGRALALTDWDHDGDVDVWIKNRTAPTLRFLRNQTRGPQPGPSDTHSRFLELGLVGRASNRDAIGARVIVRAGQQTLIDGLRAGEGYLAQSSAWLHFGLGTLSPADEDLAVTVRWPSGDQQEFTGLRPDRRYRLIQGEAQGVRTADRDTAAIRIDPLPPPDAAGRSADAAVEHVVLSDRFVLPETAYNGPDDYQLRTDELLGKPALLVLWSPAPGGGADLMRNIERDERLKAVRTVPICVCDDTELAAARSAQRGEGPFLRADAALLDLLDLLQQEVLGRPDDLVLPTLLVVDANGRLISLFRGGAEPAEVMADIERPASAPYPHGGRTLYPQVRRYDTVADELGKRGHRELEQQYRLMLRRLREGGG